VAFFQDRNSTLAISIAIDIIQVAVYPVVNVIVVVKTPQQ
jgi:hypothetical protein